jgi:histidinol-phosphate aminotransferase
MSTQAGNLAQLLQPHVAGLRGYTPGKQDPSCTKLNTNECPIPPSPAVLEALRAIAPDALRLYPQPVSAAVREAAHQLTGWPSEGILVGNGSDDCLTILWRAILAPQASVATSFPTYGLYQVLSDIQGAQLVTVPYDLTSPPGSSGSVGSDEKGQPSWSLPLKGLIEAQADMTIIANPNNPSGTLVPRQVLRELAAGVRGILVIDEAYIDFAPDGSSFLKDLADYPNVVVLRTMSKSYSLAGARLGLAFAAPELIDQLLKIKDSYNVNALTQTAAVAALNDQAYLKHLVALVLTERQRCEIALAELGYQSIPSAANFLLTHIGPQAGQLQAWLSEQGYLVRYWPTPELGEYLRITIGTAEVMDEFLELVRRWHHEQAHS